MPTLNEEYNRVLSTWTDGTPECEECGCDLTGLNVVETDYMWLCEGCADAPDERDGENFHSEDFLIASERRQMGLSAL